MSTTRDDNATASTDSSLNCPVPDCDYTNDSTQGIMGHVGNGHDDGWDATDVTPHDLHEEATLRQPGAVERAASVKAWLEEEGVPVEKFRFYEHQGYGSIHAVSDAHLERQEFISFRSAVVNADAGTFSGDRAWLPREFAETLPEPSHADLKHYLRVSS